MNSNIPILPIALVTGGTRGIGLACALELASNGFRVIAVGRSLPSESLVCEIDGVENLEFLKIDLANPVGVSALCKHVNSIGELNVVVHALGGTLGVGRDDCLEEWERVHWLNFSVAVEINRNLLSEGGGHRVRRILHISSSAAVHGKASLPYVCSKAALNAYVKAEGRRLVGEGISIVAIMPAAVSGLGNVWEEQKESDPERWDRVLSGQCLGRFQTPEEIAKLVVWLTGDEGILFASQSLLADANA